MGDAQIEITDIRFVDNGQANGKRTALVQVRVVPRGNEAFVIPMQFDAGPEDEGKVVGWAKAALHLLTSRLADQTKGWNPPE